MKSCSRAVARAVEVAELPAAVAGRSGAGCRGQPRRADASTSAMVRLGCVRRVSHRGRETPRHPTPTRPCRGLPTRNPTAGSDLVGLEPREQRRRAHRPSPVATGWTRRHRRWSRARRAARSQSRTSLRRPGGRDRSARMGSVTPDLGDERMSPKQPTERSFWLGSVCTHPSYSLCSERTLATHIARVPGAPHFERKDVS